MAQSLASRHPRLEAKQGTSPPSSWWRDRQIECLRALDARLAMPPRTHLLAVDLGLRLGWAQFDDGGVLFAYGSRHLGNRAALKSLAWALVVDVAPGGVVVAEGDRLLAAPFSKAAAKRGLTYIHAAAETWRPTMLLDREQRSGAEAKSAALERARAIIHASRAPAPTSLTTDTAEAILLGVWAHRRA